MPIYEYRCADCGGDFEQLVRASDTPACPFCEGVSLERKLSTPAFGASASSSAPRMVTSPRGGCCGGGCGCH